MITGSLLHEHIILAHYEVITFTIWIHSCLWHCCSSLYCWSHSPQLDGGWTSRLREGKRIINKLIFKISVGVVKAGRIPIFKFWDYPHTNIEFKYQFFDFLYFFPPLLLVFELDHKRQNKTTYKKKKRSIHIRLIPACTHTFYDVQKIHTNEII